MAATSCRIPWPFPIFNGGCGRADSGGQPDTYVTPLAMKCGAITDAAHLPKDVWFYKNGARRICV
jgi:hypothetical protein